MAKAKRPVIIVGGGVKLANAQKEVKEFIKKTGFPAVTSWSGLDVIRYDAESLHQEFGVHFHLLDSSKELHRTPFGAIQQFVYCLCRLD